MDTKTQHIAEVETWLPVFSGFYGTIWETDNGEEMEIENINYERKERGLAPITWDEVEWDYEGYRKKVSRGITRQIGEDLKKSGMIMGYRFQALNSPREYNFRNDSVDVVFILTDDNRRTIREYLRENKEGFAKYLEKYVSRSGFISSYSDDVNVWLVDENTLDHTHQLGSILNFILLNEKGDEYEVSLYENMVANGYILTATNANQLMEGK